MVFPSASHVYLEPPNWNLQQAHQQGASSISGSDVQHQLQQPMVSVPEQQPEGEAAQETAGGAARPGSMVERARLAKMPQPEAALKCPRCESTNTKFCYFNNYSLTQPRHFCKTCRRYWTRGGTLRNVPVGGGFRRNKRANKSSSSKSLGAAPASAFASSSATSAAPAGIFPPASLPFMSPWHHLPEYSFSGIQSATPVDASEYCIGGGGASSNVGNLEQWGIHQLPFLGPGMVSSTSMAPATAPTAPGLYSFDGELVGGYGAGDLQFHARAPTGTTGLIAQMGSVKMEERSQGLISMPRQFLGSIPRSDQQQLWSGDGGGSSSGGGGTAGGGWMSSHPSGFNSSSTGNWL